MIRKIISTIIYGGWKIENCQWAQQDEGKEKIAVSSQCFVFFYNGQQIVLALDENGQDWGTYDEECLSDTFVIAWKVLESREEIEKHLG